MGKLHYIPFEDEADDIKEKVESYWTKRADGFFNLRRDEIESNKADRWVEFILKELPQNRPLNILDVGCGTGFFEIILGRLSHKIIGIDLTPEMINKANEMIRIYGLDGDRVKAIVGDAENVDFESEFFDVVISRNLTWTLPHPVDAYKEWHRVLKEGGILLNFDAEYAKGAHNLKSPENLAHRNIEDRLKDECHNIYHMLTISMLDRPDWDRDILSSLGFYNIRCNKDFGQAIFVEKDEFYIPDKMFSIRAVKG